MTSLIATTAWRSWKKNSRLSKTFWNVPGALLLLDFEKAFDKLDWGFVQDTLAFFNFGPDLKQWISTFYRNLDIRIQDQTIIRLLLENYQKFLSSFEEQQWRSSLHIRQSSFPSSGTYQRLDTVRSILCQKGDLNIRQISQHLFPPSRRRRESEPIYFKGRLTSSLSFEETFEGIFSDDEETVVDPLSTSSFT
ncbi:hypothetical protein BSL78_11328 [Apostichopus japonicus]|uniref:Reverse transcriptase domain-containing protein n=1 Tax=Stichopus japonicus TaxID=307972 RepID=A0A2G8KUW6_STIJA|nr:hypothetical protein BSL78_11328 [Apostichopus japonicus]